MNQENQTNAKRMLEFKLLTNLSDQVEIKKVEQQIKDFIYDKLSSKDFIEKPKENVAQGPGSKITCFIVKKDEGMCRLRNSIRVKDKDIIIPQRPRIKGSCINQQHNQKGNNIGQDFIIPSQTLDLVKLKALRILYYHHYQSP